VRVPERDAFARTGATSPKRTKNGIAWTEYMAMEIS